MGLFFFLCRLLTDSVRQSQDGWWGSPDWSEVEVYTLLYDNDMLFYILYHTVKIVFMFGSLSVCSIFGTSFSYFEKGYPFSEQSDKDDSLLFIRGEDWWMQLREENYIIICGRNLSPKKVFLE